MKIEIKDGRVTFNGSELKDADLSIQLKSNTLLEKVKNDYTLDELIEMVKVKARLSGLEFTPVFEKQQ